jgi:serine/threonine protein phosphatase PrpC
MKKFGYSVIGPRDKNEDYFEFVQVNGAELFCIADGVGGNSCGEFASQFAVKTFIEDIKGSSELNIGLNNILKGVHTKLTLEADARPNCKGMATTFIGLYIKNDFAYIVHTGDSRLYLLRGNGLRQLTEDHTEAQRMKNEGLLTQEAFLTYPRRNILYSALGVRDDPTIAYLSLKCQIKDRLIIATDGFYEVFEKAELRNISLENNDFNNFVDSLSLNLTKKKLKDNATYVSIEL